MEMLYDVGMEQVEKQSDKPRYEDILWNRPVRKTGRVLLIGGHKDGFIHLQQAFASFEAAGIAETRLALPDKLSKFVKNLIGVSLVASTPSGSIARDALAELTYLANEADLVSLGPDLSNNSETTLVMQRLMQETRAAILIPPESAEQLMPEADEWKNNNNILLFLSHKQLYKLAAKFAVDTTIPLSPTAETTAEIAQNDSEVFAPSLVITFEDNVIVAVAGKVSMTKSSIDIGTYGSF